MCFNSKSSGFTPNSAFQSSIFTTILEVFWFCSEVERKAYFASPKAAPGSNGRQALPMAPAGREETLVSIQILPSLNKLPEIHQLGAEANTVLFPDRWVREACWLARAG